MPALINPPSYLIPEETIQLKFDMLDSGNKGYLTEVQAEDLATQLGEKAETFFSFYFVDEYGVGHISFDDFMWWYRLRYPDPVDSAVAKACKLFDEYDKDGSGKVDKGDLKMLLEKTSSVPKATDKNHLDTLFREMVPDIKRRSVTLVEFLLWCKNKTNLTKETRYRKLLSRKPKWWLKSPPAIRRQKSDFQLEIHKIYLSLHCALTLEEASFSKKVME